MKHILLFVAAAMVLAVFSCVPPTGGTAGSLTVSFSPSGIANRTILPDLDMEIAGYVVSGSGPDGASFQVETSGTSVVVEKLAFGDWTVTVEARNADEVVIGSGTGNATVHTGQSALVSITVTPLEGYGTLDLTVTWPAGDTENPALDASLIPAAGAAQTLDFATEPGIATYHSETIPTGYHTLIVKLLDNGLLAMGAVDVVRIVKGGVSTGLFEFTEINQPGGNIEVNITPEMAEPLTVSMTGQVAELSQGMSMTVTASVAEPVGNVIYVWYVNGESVGSGQTVTLGSDLGIGVYRLDVTAFTADGLRAGSTGAMFHVVEGVPELINIEWQRCLGGSMSEETYSIKQTNDSGYIVAGYTTSNDGDVSGNHGGTDIWVVKLDINGAIEWQKCLGGSSREFVFSIQQTNDTGYIIAGSTESNDGDVSGNHGGSDGWVVKLDINGAIEWQKCLGGSNTEQLSSIHQTNDAGYIVAGYTASNDGDISGNHVGRDGWVAKLDINGAIEWQRCLGGSSIEWAGNI